MEILITHYKEKEKTHPYINFLVDELAKKDVRVIGIKPFFRKNVFSNIKKLFQYRGGIVHIHWFPFNFETWLFFYFIFRLFRYKIVYTVHNIYPHECEWWKKFAARFLYNHSDALVVHYHQNKSKLISLGIRTPISIIPHPNFNYNYNKFTKESARDILGLKGHEKILLFFGAIREYKGLDDLLNAFKIVKKRFRDIKLLIVGSGKWSNFKLSISPNKDILFINEYVFDEDIEKYFKAVDLVVYPFKRIDGSGSLLLAYNFEKPFVTTKTGGIPEEVEKYGGGILANPCDPRDLARGVCEALKNPPSFSKQRNITWQDSALKYLDIYSQLSKLDERV